MNAQVSLTNLVYAVRVLKRLWVKETLVVGASAIEQAAEQLRNTIPQDVLWGLNGRFERGVALANQGAVSPHSDPVNPDKHRLFKVKSANQSRPPYHYLEVCFPERAWSGFLMTHVSQSIEPVSGCRRSAIPGWQRLPVGLRP
jgi:hypothetical protein